MGIEARLAYIQTSARPCISAHVCIFSACTPSSIWRVGALFLGGGSLRAGRIACLWGRTHIAQCPLWGVYKGADCISLVVRCMFPFHVMQESPAHYTNTLFKATFPHLLCRGMKIKKLSDTQVMVYDIDEWLWADQQTLQCRNKYELCFDVYSSANSSDDTLRGIIIVVTASRQPLLLWWWKLLLAMASCVVLMLWTWQFYVLQVFDHGSLFHEHVLPDP